MIKYCHLCKREVAPRIQHHGVLWAVGIFAAFISLLATLLLWVPVLVVVGTLFLTNFLPRVCPICGSSDLGVIRDGPPVSP